MGGTGVAVAAGGMGVKVGGTGVAVAVGGMGVKVAGTGVAVAVAGMGVGVAVASPAFAVTSQMMVFIGNKPLYRLVRYRPSGKAPPSGCVTSMDSVPDPV